MAEINFNQFGAGWVPSDDPAGGRKNGLIQMDNLELDRNGALTLSGGTSIHNSGFGSAAHTLFSRLFGSSSKDYAALVNGTVYRESSSIISGGDTSNAAFGTAFDFTLIASGAQRKKDNGTSLVDLGVGKATVAPTLITQTYEITEAAPLLSSLVNVTGTHSVVAGALRLALSSGAGVVQTYNAAGAPFDLRTFGDGSIETDNDILYLEITSFDPSTDTFQIDLLLTAGNGSGDLVSNVYSFTPTPADILASNYFSDTSVLKIRRSQFQRIGSGVQDWDTVHGFRITYTTTGVATTVDIRAGFADMGFYGGSNAQDGAYEYAQMNVYDTGFYQAKSELGPASLPVRVEIGQSQIRLQTPTDTQVTEVWLFRRAFNGQALLDQWYRVAVVPIASLTDVVDVMGDQDALTLDITVNLNLTSIAYSSIPDKIWEIIGPVQGRWYYFTTHFMYPSDVNNPDLVDVSIGVRTSGSSSEKFMWARAVAEAVILVGTSLNIYVLTGTFATLPDGTVDIYYRPLGCKYPPITNDAAEYGGRVYYLANDGWRSFAVNGENQLLVAPNTDRLYRGITCAPYSPPSIQIAPGSARFPLVIARNKMWCFITGTNRCEVYDFLRQYWRPFDLGLGQATAAFSTPDGVILTFWPDGSTRQLDVQSSKLVDSTYQTCALTTPILDAGIPKQRKDSYTLKVRCSGAGSLTVYVNGTSVGSITLAAALTDYPLDLSQIFNTPIKTYQVQIIGTVSELILNDVTINFDARPVQLSFLRITPTNLGSASKKRLRVWPIVIDTLGNQVIATVGADGVDDTPVSISNSLKGTALIKTVRDLFAIDYGLTLYCPTGLFEYWDSVQPDIVQHLPIARRFDQVGPAELFKYGRIKQFEIRVLPLGDTIPCTIYFNDNSLHQVNIPVTSGVEKSYFVGVPKGVGGEIVRIELGPTSFDFHRYHMRIQVMKSGRDTELEWIGLPEA